MRITILKLLSLWIVYSPYQLIAAGVDGILTTESVVDAGLIPETYLDQSLHSAFLISGQNSISSDCTFYRRTAICNFKFENSIGFVSEISIPYASLTTLSNDILASLFELKNQWDTEYPTNGILRLHPTRGADHQNLEFLIQELQAEPLHLRVLQPSYFNRDLPAFIYNRTRAEQIYSVFWQHMVNTGQYQCQRNCITPQGLN